MIAIIFLKEKSLKIFIYLYLLLVAGLGGLQLFFSPIILFQFINHLVSDGLNIFFEILTFLGSGWTYAAVCIAIFFLNKKYAWLSVACFSITGFLAQLIKYFLPNIERPVQFFADRKTTILFPKGAEELHWNSFPSGHTVSAFSMCLLLSYVFKNRIASLVFLLLAVFIAISRVYLTAHFVRDIYFGMIIGIEITSILIYLFERKNQLE